MLKFEGIPIGSHIRAYDFVANPEYYIEGEIVDTPPMCADIPCLTYRVEVSVDTLCPLQPRKVVFVPFETTFDYDGRVVVLEEPWKQRTDPMVGAQKLSGSWGDSVQR